MAPGRRAPGAMPRPLTSGSGLAGSGLAGSASGSAGASDSVASGSAAGGLRRCRLLGARPSCTCGDAQALDLRLGLRRCFGFGLGRSSFCWWRCLGCRGFLGSWSPCTCGDAKSLDLGLGGRLCRGRGLGSGGGGGLLGAGTFGASGDAEALDGGAAAAGFSSAGAASEVAAFLAPGRFAPPAMPRPCDGLGVGSASKRSKPGPRASASASASGSASTWGPTLRRAASAACSASLAAVPFSGSVTLLVSSEFSSSWATSSTSALGTSLVAATSSTPSVIITRQNGQPVAIVERGVHRLFGALGVDALADVLFHPHPRAAGAAAQATVGVARHLGELRPGRADQLTRRLVDLVVPTQVAGVVVGDV